MNDQHARLNQTLAEQGITERRAQAPSRASAAGVGGLRSYPPPTGTWTINSADTSISLAWRKLWLWTVTGRLPCLDVVHLDDVPPVGVIRVQQPSGLPVRTMALDPLSEETQDPDLDTRLRGPDVLDVMQHRWWTLPNESLEVVPAGALRVMATLTARGTAGLLELRFEVDAGASGPDWPVLRGRGVLDRRALGMGRQASIFDPKIRLDLALRARRVATGISTQVDLIADGCTACHPASVRSEFSTERGASEGQARPSAGSGHSKTLSHPNTMTGQPARTGVDRDAA
jgi:polyisoprenoid-binding protein YceI